MLLATNNEVDLATVQMAMPKAAPVASSTFSSGPLAERVDAFEREVILAELKRSHLYKKAEQLGIDMRAMRREQESAHE